MITADPYSSDPSIPRKITPTGVTLDPLTQPPTVAPPAPAAPAPTQSPAPSAAPNVNAIPASTASTISQLPDGAGGAVTVPPPSMAPGAGPNINMIPSPTAAPGGAMPSTFSADQNLINSQINPASSARLLNTQGMTDQALQQALSGPDRLAIAKQYYDAFDQNHQNAFGHALTDATNRAAAHGQIGSGMLTNKYGDLTQQFNLDDNTARSNFMTNALEGTIGDRLNNANLARTAENSIYGQDVNSRNELRGERGYQQNLAEQAIAQRIQQTQMEQGQQQQNFDNAARLYGYGNLNDPTGAYQNAAALSSSEASGASGDVGALLRAWLASRQPTGV